MKQIINTCSTISMQPISSDSGCGFNRIIYTHELQSLKKLSRWVTEGQIDIEKPRTLAGK